MSLNEVPQSISPANFQKPTGSKYDALTQQVSLLKERMIAQHRLLKSSLIALKNVDARFEALRKMLVDANTIDEQKYQTLIDANLGLRLRDESEKIIIGDVAWVSYTAIVDGEKETIVQKNMPIRVGSQSVVFEEGLIGRQPHTKGVTYTAVYKNGKLKGKAINFTIDIHQVKQNIAAGATAAATTSEDTDGPDDGRVEGQSESVAEVNGSGHQERSDGQPEPIQ